MSASARLSVRLQDIAQSLAEVLDEVAGEPHGVCAGTAGRPGRAVRGQRQPP
ncbi:hypothetical protein PEC18_05140 [Paucibacter sp. O1-1]|nr:hypothetical protein [Paucibacter sp. O1-1]MDA3825255.1 hypothetical protein [Paucibacter sp. O1-1]